MFEVSFEATFYAMLQVFVLGFIGYILVKSKFIDVKGLEFLSALVINIMLPAFNFSQIIGHFNPHTFPNWWFFPFLGFIVTLGGLFLATGVLAVSPSFKARKEFQVMIAFQNSGYMPLTILAAFPMTEMIGRLNIYILLFLIGFDILLWTLGVWLMTGGSKQHFNWRKLINPPMLATLSSVILMCLGVGQHIPEVVARPINMLGNCLLPMVMLVLGGNFAFTNLKKVPWSGVAGVVLTKLFVYPLLMITIVTRIPVSPLIGFLLVMEAAMPCANSLSVLGRYYKTENQDFINQGLFFTNVLSIVTIPVFLAVYSKLI